MTKPRRCVMCGTEHRNPVKTVHDFCPVAQDQVKNPPEPKEPQ